MQELASKNKNLVQEVPPAKPACVASEMPFRGISLEASLDFASSPDALSVVKHFKQGIEQKKAGEVETREAVISALSEKRCSEGPMIGQDALQALKISRSVSDLTFDIRFSVLYLPEIFLQRMQMCSKSDIAESLSSPGILRSTSDIGISCNLRYCECLQGISNKRNSTHAWPC